MSESFYKVQIAYMGVIPKLNRQGPIREALMTERQIKELQAIGVEVLNYGTGKPIEFPKETVSVAAATKHEAEAAAAIEEEKAAEEPEVEETKEEVVETETAEDSDDAEQDTFDTFDGSKIEGFDQLNKAKRKKARRKYYEVMEASKDLPIDEAAAKAYEEVAKFIQTLN